MHWKGNVSVEYLLSKMILFLPICVVLLIFFLIKYDTNLDEHEKK